MKSGDHLVLGGDAFGCRGHILNWWVRLFYQLKNLLKEQEKLIKFHASPAALEEISEKIAGANKRLSDALYQDTGHLCEVSNNLVLGAAHSGTYFAWMGWVYPAIQEIIDREAYENLQLLKILKPLAASGADIWYLGGNSEIGFNEFIVPQITEEEGLATAKGFATEVLKPWAEHFLRSPEAEAIFQECGIQHVTDEPVFLEEFATLLLPVQTMEAQYAHHGISWPFGLDPRRVKHIISHYPPSDEKIEEYFFKYYGLEYNSVDKLRTKAVEEISAQCPNLETIRFGHLHLGIDPESRRKMPSFTTFQLPNGISAIHNAPGEIAAIPAA